MAHTFSYLLLDCTGRDSLTKSTTESFYCIASFLVVLVKFSPRQSNLVVDITNSTCRFKSPVDVKDKGAFDPPVVEKQCSAPSGMRGRWSNGESLAKREYAPPIPPALSLALCVPRRSVGRPDLR